MRASFAMKALLLQLLQQKVGSFCYVPAMTTEIYRLPWVKLGSVRNPLNPPFSNEIKSVAANTTTDNSKHHNAKNHVQRTKSSCADAERHAPVGFQIIFKAMFADAMIQWRRLAWRRRRRRRCRARGRRRRRPGCYGAQEADHVMKTAMFKLTRSGQQKENEQEQSK